MVEDVEDGPNAGTVQWAVDWGRPREELPEEVEDLSPAEEVVRNFNDVLRSMFDAHFRRELKIEQAKHIVLPEGMS